MSFDSVAGLPCTVGGLAGAISLSYATNGDVGLRCAVEVAVTPDVFEPNDTLAQAAVHPLPVIEFLTRSIQANFHSGDVDDWYVVQGFADETCDPGRMALYRLVVTLTGIPVGSDYDLRASLSSSPEERASQNPGNAAEQVIVAGNADCLDNLMYSPLTFYIHVIRVGGEPTNAPYTLLLQYQRRS